MARFGLCGPAYRSQSPNADAETCINFYCERIEQQGRAQYALYPVPGKKLFAGPLGDGPVRAEITTRNSGSGVNRTFQLIGSKFYELFADGTSNQRGVGVTNDGQRVSICAGPTQILFASTGRAYVYDLVANTLTLLPAGTLTNVSFVGYSDGFFIALQKNSNQLNTSQTLNAAAWPPANFTFVSIFPDNILSMLVDHREIFLWSGSKSIIYYDSGNLFPFDPNPSGIIEQGISAPLSSVKADNAVFWLNGSERGQGIFFRTQGYLPVRISDHGVEYAISKYARLDDCVGYTMEDQGHTFCVWYFPTANKTWAYDVSTGFWHERASWNQTAAKFDADQGWGHTFNFGKHLLSDAKTGNIYDLSINYLDDNGKALRRERIAPQISNEREWIFFPQVEIYVETGLGPEPPLLAPPVIVQSSSPTGIILVDPNGTKWNITVDDIGLLHTTVVGAGVATTLFLNDSILGNKSWQVKVTIAGLLTTTGVAFNAANVLLLPLASTPSLIQTGIQISNGLLQTTLPASTPRDPQLMLSWSDDGGHTFSNEYALDCGQAGKFRKRAIKRRLGKSRGRNFKIAVSDPVPWRIVDAYIPPAQERYAEQVRKVT